MYCQKLLFFLVAALAVLTSVTARMSVKSPLIVRAHGSDDDSFYTPPKGWKDEEPGTILKQRKVTIAQSGIFKIGVDGYQLLYRTTGHNGKVPSHTVTTVLVPRNYDKDKLVVASVYEDSHAEQCAPSHRLLKSWNLFQNVAISYQELFFTTLLHEGWVVTVPDHEGPHNAFTSGFTEGYAVLDAVRATQNFDKLGLHDNAKVAGYGYSGGALAAGWAASLQDSYADELNMVGWSIGGTVANVPAWLRYIDGTNGAGFALASVAGLAADYPQLKWVEKNLTSKGKKLWAATKKHCMFENLWSTSYKKILTDDVFEGGSHFLNNSKVTKILDKLRLGSDSDLTPTAPVYMFHALNDDVVPYTMVTPTAEAWCNQGARVHFVTNSGSEMGHTNTELFNLPNVIFFMRDRFKGKSWGDDCKWSTVHDPWFNPLILGSSAVDFLQQVLDLIGQRIGPHDRIVHKKLANHETP